MTALIHTSTRLIFRLEVHCEQIFAIFFRDAEALICDFNVDTNLVPRICDDKLIDGHRYYVTIFRELDRILNQVDQNLLNA